MSTTDFDCVFNAWRVKLKVHHLAEGIQLQMHFDRNNWWNNTISIKFLLANDILSHHICKTILAIVNNALGTHPFCTTTARLLALNSLHYKHASSSVKRPEQFSVAWGVCIAIQEMHQLIYFNLYRLIVTEAIHVYLHYISQHAKMSLLCEIHLRGREARTYLAEQYHC